MFAGYTIFSQNTLAVFEPGSISLIKRFSHTVLRFLIILEETLGSKITECKGTVPAKELFHRLKLICSRIMFLRSSSLFLFFKITFKITSFPFV